MRKDREQKIKNRHSIWTLVHNADTKYTGPERNESNFKELCQEPNEIDFNNIVSYLPRT